MITDQDILRYLEGKASADEAEQIKLWLDQSENNRKQFESFRSVWSASASIANYKQIDVDAEWEEFSKLVSGHEQIEEDQVTLTLNNKRKFSILPYSIAASLAILIGAFFFMPNQDQSQDLTYQQEHKQDNFSIETQENIESIVLSDKSNIQLEAYSSLEYPYSFENSTVRQVNLLDGIATFDVTHDENKKFIVLSGGIGIEVLGTKFTIGNDKGNVSVNLRSGSIKAYQQSNPDNNIIMKPGDEITFVEEKFVTKKKLAIVKATEVEVVKPKAKTIVPVKEKAPVVVKEERKESQYPIGDVLDHLKRTFKKQIKIKRKLGVDKNEFIWIDINEKDLKTFIKNLEEVTTLDSKPGNCDDCYIITAGSQN